MTDYYGLCQPMERRVLTFLYCVVAVSHVFYCVVAGLSLLVCCHGDECIIPLC